MSQDLSSAFGEPATSRLRGLLPPRTGRETTPAEPEHQADDHAPARAGGHGGDHRHREDHHGDAPAVESAEEEQVSPPPPARRRRATTPARGSGVAVSRSPTSSTNRRWGTARVVSREHVDLLVLCALRDGPASARGIIERLRADSGGALQAPERTVHNTLHRLARNRLLHRVHGGTTGGPHYGLTMTGERAAQARARQWRLFARAVGDVVGEPDPR